MLDQTGNALGALLAAQFTVLPINPTDGYNSLIPSNQITQSNNNVATANAQQLQYWTTVANVILTYLVTNTELKIPSLPVPATGLDDSGGHACTGTANTTAQNGVGSIE